MSKQHQHIGIAGYGLEGRALYEHFKDTRTITIFDEQIPESLPSSVSFEQSLTIPTSIDVVYKSPGIPTHKLILESSKTRISTLLDLVLHAVRDRAIGVTGTKGKSTTASLTHHILKENGYDAVLFGNIGVADMALVFEAPPERLFVFECSSYQCEHITTSPHIAVLTNLFPEHLTHHGSFKAYREAKLNLARFQTDTDLFINGSEERPSFQAKEIHPQVTEPFKTLLKGEHNQKNCAFAYAVTTSLGLTDDAIREAISTFVPLPYRLEKVGTYKGVEFYDDSLATIPEATLASIEALKKVDTIILGGSDRKLSFEWFAKKLKETAISTFIIFPDTGERMVTEVMDRNIVRTSSMEEAIEAAYTHTPAGGTVLLSNASPSFSLFKDYKDKSAQFRYWVEKRGGKTYS